MRTAFKLGLTLCLAGLPTVSTASGPDLFGHGARAQALAGAAVSTARRHNAVYYNPAALTASTRPSFSLGFQREGYRLTLNGDAANEPASQATSIGVVLPLALGGILERRLALGAAFFVPTASVLVADVPAPEQPRFTVVGDRARTVSLQAALGARVGWGLSVGVGFIALAELDGAIEVAPNSEGRIGSQARDQLVADYAGVFSVHWQGPSDWAAGLTHRQASVADFKLPIEVNLGDKFPLPVPELNVVGTAQFDPAATSAEISGPVGPLRLALGATHKIWSDYPNPIAYTAPAADLPAQPAPNFSDTTQWRLGAEWPVALGPVGLEARGGYQFSPTPAPEQSGLHNYLDSDRHTIGAGIGLTWQRIHLDLATQYHHLTARTHEKKAAHFEGTGFTLEDNPASPSVRHEGHIMTVAVELGVTL